jgi:ABC-type uncharacterized transport system permease subunit
MSVLTGLINGMITGQPQYSGSISGSFTYFAGVFNIAMEGMMLTGAFFAVWGSYTFATLVHRRLAGDPGLAFPGTDLHFLRRGAQDR